MGKKPGPQPDPKYGDPTPQPLHRTPTMYTSMRLHPLVSRLALLVTTTGCFLCPAVAPAQTESGRPDPEGKNAPALQLSPFSVNAEKENGYSSTSTLAGSRLNTQLRDVGAAISVLTKDFFKDTGATDAETVLSYALNMEVSGAQGNFAGSSTSSTGTMDVTETRPQRAHRLRQRSPLAQFYASTRPA